MKHGHRFQDTQLGRRAIAILKVTIVTYRATGGAVRRRAVLKSNVTCRVDVYRALLQCGSSRLFFSPPPALLWGGEAEAKTEERTRINEEQCPTLLTRCSLRLLAKSARDEVTRAENNLT